MRPVKFSFEGGPDYLGFTDDTHWNGWLNVEVDKDVFDKVLADFRAEYGDDFTDMVGDMPDIEPDENGRYSFANCYCISESEAPEIEQRTDVELHREIAQLQDIQKSCPPSTPKWRTSSELLAPLFEEMARRQTEMRQETRAAKERTGKMIGVSVENGEYRVEEIIPRGETSDVIPLSDCGSMAYATEFMRNLK